MVIETGMYQSVLSAIIPIHRHLTCGLLNIMGNLTDNSTIIPIHRHLTCGHLNIMGNLTNNSFENMTYYMILGRSVKVMSKAFLVLDLRSFPL